MNKLLAICLAAIAVFVVSDARAEDGSLWITTGLWSTHNKQEVYKYNQNNSGFGVQYSKNKNTGYIIGKYKNSLYRDTIYIGKIYTPIHYLGANNGIMVAMVTGYKHTTLPVVSLYSSFEYKKVGINFMSIPTVVYAVQLKFKLN